jgi:hypothetical protein
MLVLYYGGILPLLPWWIVWFPSLIVIVILAFSVVVMAFLVIIAAIFG